MLTLIYSDRAAEPAGEAKTEWEIARLLAAKLTERAQARGLSEYQSQRGMTHNLSDLASRFTLGGALVTEEDAAEEMLRYDAAQTAVPPEIARRLQKSVGDLPAPKPGWWKRLLGGTPT
jgi:anaerobic selenocysteine-containing dehydrogenase